jgi:hypothetical protein
MQKTQFEGYSVVLYKPKRLKHILVKELTADVIGDALIGNGQWKNS